MTYRDNALDPDSPPALTFPRAGPVARWFMTLIVVVAAAFFAGMTGLTARDSWLQCEPVRGGASCVLHNDYPAGIERHVSLPQVIGAHVESRVSRDRHGSHLNRVLVLDHAYGITTEFEGVGKNGERADGVASGLSALLRPDARGERRLRLRESSYAATLMLLVCALGSLFTVPIWLRRVRVAFNPRDRRVSVRVGRWPAKAYDWSQPIDHLARAERVTTQHRIGLAHSARLVPRDGAGGSYGELELGYSSASNADAVVRALDAALAGWRAT